MKKFTFLFVLAFLAMSFKGISQIKVNSTGKVGINNSSPAYQLDVNGSLRVTAGGAQLIYETACLYPYNAGYSSCGTVGDMWQELYAWYPYFYSNPTILSDVNAKTDIKDLSDTKSKLLVLRPVTYKLKPEFIGKEKVNDKIVDKEAKDQLGLIAQEVQEVFPEIVTAREDGTLGIRYTDLVPVLIKAMQEQQGEIDDLKARLEKLENATK